MKDNDIKKEPCRSVCKQELSAIGEPKDAGVTELAETPKQWSGQPGKDLFFNGWKLLF